MTSPRTPKTGEGYQLLLYSLNADFNLELPISSVATPSKRCESNLQEQCAARLKFLFFKSPDALDRVLQNFQEWARSITSEWGRFAQSHSRAPGSSFLHRTTTDRARNLSFDQKTKLVEYLGKLLADETYLIQNGSFETTTSNWEVRKHGRREILSASRPTVPESAISLPSRVQKTESLCKRRTSQVHEVYVTAPNSSAPVHVPVPSPARSSGYSQAIVDEFDDPDLDDLDFSCLDLTDASDTNQARSPKKQQTLEKYMTVSKRGTMDPPSSFKSMNNANDHSFSTVNASSTNVSFGASTAATSFMSNVLQAEAMEKESQCSSAAGVFQSEEYRSFEETIGINPPNSTHETTCTISDPVDDKVFEIVHDLETKGPFSKRAVYPATLPFRYRYEAERVAAFRQIPVEGFPFETPLPEYDAFWKSLQCGGKSFLEKSKSDPWKAAVGEFKGPEGNVVTLSGQLDWARPSEGYLKLTLNPLKFERGYRFCRRFGSDRFLEITFPSLSKPPRHLKSIEPHVLLRAVATWLATSEHHILGRVWRGFYIEEVKTKNRSVKISPTASAMEAAKEDAKEIEMRSKVYLFATDGPDFATIRNSGATRVSPREEASERHSPMTVEALINWHMPLKQNKGQKDCKLFQRISLGLSRTLSTVVVRPEEIIYLEQNEPIMNDGCALISISLATQIAHMLGLESLPACFQGRIAGAKGIWMVDRDDSSYQTTDRNFWIEINNSQLKVKPSPDRNEVHLDDEQLSFEVVAWSKPLHPVFLNLQLLRILQHGGVSKAYIEDLVRREIALYYEEFAQNISSGNIVTCRKWVQKHRPRSEAISMKRKARYIDGFPTEMVEQAILLLESGFLPLKLPFLTEIFKGFLVDYFDNLRELRIRASQSTYAYCIADPYGVLAPDEVHFGFSQPWEVVMENGIAPTDLDGVDVLLGRLPANLPSDVQKRRAVFKKELRHFKDVIVFPTTGNIPLASELSGGDYDGDTPWICWDPEIVRAFTNTPFREEDLPTAEDFGLVNHSKSMSDHQSFDDFLSNVFIFNSLSTKLGVCTNQHEKLCYHENSISSKNAIKLAGLLSLLVDSRKSGLELRADSWKKFRNDFGRSLPAPAYKCDNPPANIRDIIDHLKFYVIQKEQDRCLETFHNFRQVSSALPVDSDLTDTWNKIEKRAEAEKEEDKPVLFTALWRIKGDIRRAREEWEVTVSLMDKRSYASKISMATEKLQDVSPPIFDHPLSHTWQNSQDEWNKVRASCVYKLFSSPSSPFVWFSAGITLCEIKVKAMGHSRTVAWDVYRTFKLDRKTIKKIESQALKDADGEDDDEETMYKDADVFSDIDVLDMPGAFETDIGSEDEDWVSLA
ncbi:hypothetical protein AJ80_10001 [Polytolypa hystricis UAMH7299]|uniref:RNA-dependent RNA polymerase n=1 Tax=Polytolypa hystricis (strain UAMH7299) TaxID=1447883 RepID=A0A2B7WF61_POLH7|nr:hypothetical protein AJ80_10001 [Polytolypa hystricis UAMH7299]